LKTFLQKVSSFISKKHLFSPASFYTGGILLIIPFLLVVIFFFIHSQEAENLRERITVLQKKSLRKENQIKNEEKILSQISNSRLGYLEEVLTPMAFLATERQKWKIFSEQVEPSHPMKERVSFLDHGTNKLQFIQSEMRKNEIFQETEEKQKNPIEVSEEDLKTLLCYIEGSQIHPHLPKEGAPQILLKSFELEKKVSPGITEKTYQIQMQLIKREALSK